MRRNRSRKLVRSIAALQFLAWSGCSFIIDGAEEKEDVPNAYRCQCECETDFFGETVGESRNFDVCLPEDQDDLAEDCNGRVREVMMGIIDQCVALVDPDDCECVPVAGHEKVVEACDEECLSEVLELDCSNVETASTIPGVEPPVCLSEGTAMASTFFERSTCEIQGDITVDRLDDCPTTATEGVVEFIGTPCPGQSCEIDLFYALEEAVFEFPGWNPLVEGLVVFDNIRPIGASVTPALLSASGGVVFSPGTVASSSRGRRRLVVGDESLVTGRAAIAGTNAEPLDVSVLWDARECSLSGAAIGAADDEDFSIEVVMSGVLVNLPPTAGAGEDHDVECTSPQGAQVTLDAGGSTDPDDNIVLVQWRLGGPAGDDIGHREAVVHPFQALDTTETYTLSVLDAFWQISQDSVMVNVVDTTAPEIDCGAPPTITPPDAPISFTATAVDTCDADLAAPVIDGFDCYFLSPSGRRIDKTDSCVVEVQGDTIHIIDVGGIGTRIAWHAATSDASGNPGEAPCEVEVVRPN